MDSLKELFKVGNGPSSSHTMGPEKAASIFKEETPDASRYIVELYGSLAATGKGHLTDWIIIETLKPKETEIIWNADYIHPFHTNGVKFKALDDDNNVIKDWLVFSVGGGTIKDESQLSSSTVKDEVYTLNKLNDIIKFCKENNKELWQYVEDCEENDIWSHLKYVRDTMFDSVKRGLKKDGILPSELVYPRKAKQVYEKSLSQKGAIALTNKIFSYALAVSEENASAGKVVTSPTCGSAGVVPGLLVAMAEEYDLDETTQLRGLAIAGIVGNLIKENATISGAEGGCQAEIGAACSMASAMAVYFLDGDIDQMEYAAEIGMEHHLGMTCDPVGGFVIIPCIERNAIVATRSFNTAIYVMSSPNSEHSISFDDVVVTMKETGRDMCSAYKETSTGGLAKYYDKLLRN